MIVQDDRGSLLTKGSLYNHFYRADARHEISCRKARIFVSQSVQSGSLWMGMAELLLYASVTILQNLVPVTIHRLIWSFASNEEPDPT